MKKFTVKDFILSTSPCFGCRERLAFNMGSVDFSSRDPEFPISGVNTRPMVISEESSTIAIRTTYVSNLHLTIFHKTNRFQTTNLKGLKEFLKSKRVFINTQCRKCNSMINTQYLDLNLDRGFIKPVGISREDITVTDGTNNYMIHSSTLDGTSTIIVSKHDVRTVMSIPVRLEVPILPLSKFKNKEQLIEKIKLYLLFS